MQSRSSFNKFLIASAIIHLGVLVGARWTTVESVKTAQIEISFGTGKSRGGSGNGLFKNTHSPNANKKRSATQKALVSKSENNDKNKTPAVKQTSLDETLNGSQLTGTSSNLDSGNGLETTSGSGSGYTSGSGSGFDDPKIRYRGLVRQLIESRKKYPRRAVSLGQEGTVVARIIIGRDGSLLNAEILEGLSHKLLAQATLEAINGIKKFPAIPPEFGVDEIIFKIPLEYEIGGSDFI